MKATGTIERDRSGDRAAIEPGGDLAGVEVIGPGGVPLHLIVNGRQVTVLADPATTLAELLRNTLNLTGTKIGCDRGACSACTVWLDGQAASSCMTLAFDARGREIVTIEGLAGGDVLHPVQQAFVDHDAMQCGFCTPGMIMSCAALVERDPDCSLDDVKAAISGHLCRCGAYPNIFAAAMSAAQEMRSRRGRSGDRDLAGNSPAGSLPAGSPMPATATQPSRTRSAEEER